MKIAILALVALSSLGGIVHARPFLVDANVGPTSYVQVADLNLAAAQGRATATQRIRGAAAVLCANDGDRSIASQLAVHACLRDAVDNGLKHLPASPAIRGF